MEVERGGASKDVPEGEIHRLLGALRLEDAETLPGLCAPPPAAERLNTSGGGGGHGGGKRTVALRQDAGGLPAEAGLMHSDFRASEPVVPACMPHAHHATPHHWTPRPSFWRER